MTGADLAKQGFDEFMNLVIDDATEVKLATKTEEESRRQLGKHSARPYQHEFVLTQFQDKSF